MIDRPHLVCQPSQMAYGTTLLGRIRTARGSTYSADCVRPGRLGLSRDMMIRPNATPQ